MRPMGTTTTRTTTTTSVRARRGRTGVSGRVDRAGARARAEAGGESAARETTEARDETEEYLAKIEERRKMMFTTQTRSRGGTERSMDEEATTRDAERGGGGEAATSRRGTRRGEETASTSSSSRRRSTESVKSSSSSNGKTSRSREGNASRGRPETELVWVFERPGEGWGEQILPTIKAERRVVDRAVPPRAPSSGEEYLTTELGLTPDEAIAALSTAAAWRTTKKGRALVDRRRMRLAQQNIIPSTQRMFELGASREDVAHIIRNYAIVLSLDLRTEWNMRVLEYVVRQKTETGGIGGRIRKRGWTGRSAPRANDPMRTWVLEQRAKRDEAELDQEQLYILDSIGFDSDRYITKERQTRAQTWETSFEELLAFQIEFGLTNPPYEPGMTTGLGAWLEEQRELYRRGELRPMREKRLRQQGIAFDALEALKEVRNMSSMLRDVTVEPVESMLVVGTQFSQMALELKAFLNENGEYSEPLMSSPIGAWLMKTRVKVRDDLLLDDEIKALEELELDITYIPESWIDMLNKYSNLRYRRSQILGTDIAKVQAWQREQLRLMQRGDGSLSEAQINRLRHIASKDKIAGLAGESFRNAREERAKEFAEFEARIAARKARLKQLENINVNEESED